MAYLCDAGRRSEDDCLRVSICKTFGLMYGLHALALGRSNLAMGHGVWSWTACFCAAGMAAVYWKLAGQRKKVFVLPRVRERYDL